jgi:antirestriction protein ArdC
MKMTNQEIIEKEKMINGIDCEAHTYAGWLQLGYRVKKGEKATFKTSIWNKTNKKNKDAEENKEEGSGYYYMKLSHFFTIHQVEKI